MTVGILLEKGVTSDLQVRQGHQEGMAYLVCQVPRVTEENLGNQEGME